MSMSEYKLQDFFKQFDQDCSGELDYTEMFQMGNAMGITNNVMKCMIKEVDINGDGTINVEEWIAYIRKSRNTNSVDMRGVEDSNILLDFIDNKNNTKDTTRKKNVNLNDDYRLNEIEMNDAFKIAKRTSQK